MIAVNIYKPLYVKFLDKQGKERRKLCNNYGHAIKWQNKTLGTIENY